MSWTSCVTAKSASANGPATNDYIARCTGRDLARFGLMASRGGQRARRRVVSAAYLRAATQPSQDLNPADGYLWWENARPKFMAGADRTAVGLRFPGSPSDTFAAMGAAGAVRT